MFSMLALSLVLCAADAPLGPAPSFASTPRAASLVEADVKKVDLQLAAARERLPAWAPLVLGPGIGGGLGAVVAFGYRSLGSWDGTMFLVFGGAVAVGLALAGIVTAIAWAVANTGRATRQAALEQRRGQLLLELERARERERQGTVSTVPLANPLFTF